MSKDLSRLGLKLAASLFDEGELRAQFVASLIDGKKENQGLLWMGEPQEIFSRVDFSPHWKPPFVQFVPDEERPGKNSLHDEGAYYCMDPSSIFCAAILQVIPAPPRVILDICSAPGGKGIFAWRLFHPELLVANEVIEKRAVALISNLKRVKAKNVVVTSADSRFFAEKAPVSGDLVIVDAPCSGQSLLARGIESPGCFHPATINLNSNRQKRILSNSAALVRPGGHLAYMTCTYSLEENENILKWFCKKSKQFKVVTIPTHEEYRSPYTELPCYRLFPWQGGSGGFCALLKRDGEGEGEAFPLDSFRIFWSSR